MNDEQQQPRTEEEAPPTGVTLPPAAPAVPETALKVVGPPSPSPPPSEMARHTRSCNGRAVCNCLLRIESALFHKNLLEKTHKKRRAAVVTEAEAADGSAQEQRQDGEEEAPAPTRRMSLRVRAASAELECKQKPPGPQKKQKQKQKAVKKRASAKPAKRYVPVTRLGQFDFAIKLLIASFLPPAALAKLGMTNHAWESEVERMAKHTASAFLEVAARKGRLLKDEKAQADSWSLRMHRQMNCVYKVFVYYTGYKTGQMRKDYAHWAFGVVEFDPNEPHQSILPNTWKFHDHLPWVPVRANGKMGEWHLRNKYKPNRAPKSFLEEVKEWAMALQPGSFVAISYQNAGSEEPAWWEAQVWYTWRQHGNHDPAIVYDPETDTRYEVAPDNLLEHFQRHPLHVVDVTTTPTRLCVPCSTHGHSFKFCHLDKGHPML